MHGTPVVINGDGTQSRDYVHVHDVVRANLAAVDGPTGVYNIGTGVETDVNTVYQMLAAAAGVSAGAEHGPAKPGEQRRSCLDTTGTFRRLGWSAAIGFDDGARSTVEYFRTAG